MSDNTVKTGFRNATGNSSNTGIQGDFGLDKKLDNKGQSLSVALSLQRNNTDGNTNIDQNNRNIAVKDLINQSTLNKSLVGKIDYELPIGEKSIFNAGYKIDINKNDYDFGVQRKKSTDSDFSTSGLEDYNNVTTIKR